MQCAGNGDDSAIGGSLIFKTTAESGTSNSDDSTVTERLQLDQSGNVKININKFTVDASGNGQFAGTLAVEGGVSINSNRFTIEAATGNTALLGNLKSTGDLSVGNNMFYVCLSLQSCACVVGVELM